MAKGSDNPFPSILVTEGSVPSSPAAGKQRVYIDSTSHTLKRVNSSGTITSLEATSGVPSGTSFPGGPSTSDLYFRTDHGITYFYDGTRWVSTTLYVAPPNTTPTMPISAGPAEVARHALPTPPVGTDIWLVSLGATYQVASGGSALGASHKWVVTATKYNGGGSTSVTVTKSIDSGSSAVWRSDTATTIGELLGAYWLISFGAAKTGTPGNLYFYATLQYRIVST